MCMNIYVVCLIDDSDNKIRKMLFYNVGHITWCDKPDGCSLTVETAKTFAEEMRSHNHHPAGIDPLRIYVADQFGNNIEKH